LWELKEGDFVAMDLSHSQVVRLPNGDLSVQSASLLGIRKIEGDPVSYSERP
jgi:hypothetical protein